MSPALDSMFYVVGSDDNELPASTVCGRCRMIVRERHKVEVAVSRAWAAPTVERRDARTSRPPTLHVFHLMFLMLPAYIAA